MLTEIYQKKDIESVGMKKIYQNYQKIGQTSHLAVVNMLCCIAFVLQNS